MIQPKMIGSISARTCAIPARTSEIATSPRCGARYLQSIRMVFSVRRTPGTGGRPMGAGGAAPADRFRAGRGSAPDVEQPRQVLSLHEPDAVLRTEAGRLLGHRARDHVDDLVGLAMIAGGDQLAQRLDAGKTGLPALRLHQ